jgi:toxin ParE1/3/4
MLRLRYSAASKEDLKEIARFIAKDKPVAARQWVEKIREKCRLAAKYPEIGDHRRDLDGGIRSTYVGSISFTSAKKTARWKSFALFAATLSFRFSRGTHMRWGDN